MDTYAGEFDQLEAELEACLSERHPPSEKAGKVSKNCLHGCFQKPKSFADTNVLVKMALASRKKFVLKASSHFVIVCGFLVIRNVHVI